MLFSFTAKQHSIWVRFSFFSFIVPKFSVFCLFVTSALEDEKESPSGHVKPKSFLIFEVKWAVSSDIAMWFATEHEKQATEKKHTHKTLQRIITTTTKKRWKLKRCLAEISPGDKKQQNKTARLAYLSVFFILSSFFSSFLFFSFVSWIKIENKNKIISGCKNFLLACLRTFVAFLIRPLIWKRGSLFNFWKERKNVNFFENFFKFNTKHQYVHSNRFQLFFFCFSLFDNCD